MTIDACNQEFGIERLEAVRKLYEDPGGANLTTELIMAHSIEPNDDSRSRNLASLPCSHSKRSLLGMGGPTSPQAALRPPGFLRRKGYLRKPCRHRALGHCLQRSL